MPTGKKIIKVRSVVMAVAAVVATGVVAEARVEVAAVVVVIMAVVLVSPLTLYRPSATVLFQFVLKLIFTSNHSTSLKTTVAPCFNGKAPIISYHHIPI